MKVFAVMCNSWNGEYDVVSCDGLFMTKESAEKYISDMNDQSYAPRSYATFKIEEMELRE